MRLEKHVFPVSRVSFDGRTRLEGDHLFIDREELKNHLLQMGHFDDVVLDIVSPGEETRIVNVINAIEPQWKPDAPSTFPGFLGPPFTAGHGRTHRISGMAIIICGDAVAGESTAWRESLIDMWGPGAAAIDSPFSQTINLVLHCKPKPRFLDISDPDADIGNVQDSSILSQRYNNFVTQASCMAAVYLAKCTHSVKPSYTEIFELTPVETSLPRVVYAWQTRSYHVYGDRYDGVVPILLHPNEILDGALVQTQATRHASVRVCNLMVQNNTLIKELYNEHGKSIDFAGVIIFPPRSTNMDDKQKVTDYTLKLIQMLRGEGAVITYGGGGNPGIDVMLLCKKCEHAGIKTALVMPETYGNPEDAGFVHVEPEATHIISPGRASYAIQLPRAAKVLGGPILCDSNEDGTGPLSVLMWRILGLTSSTGFGRLTVKTH